MSHQNRAQVAKIAAQIGSSLMPDSDQWVNRFTVKSQSSKAVYTVAQRRTDGVWGCSCPGWRHHRKCKHLTDILHRLATLSSQVQMKLDSAALEMLKSARTAYLDFGEAAPLAAPRLAGRQLDL